MRRVVFSGTSSGSGKTSITCGVLKLLVESGLKVATFKCGCDYIDGKYHSRITKGTPHNLDSYFCNDDTLRYILGENSQGADISIIEGVMGYYDGVGFTTKGSTYELSKVTNTPVVLIVDCHGMGASIGAVLDGYVNHHKDNLIKGVIFNRISPTLYEEASKYAQTLGVTPLGYVPKLPKNALLESRHLGLVTADELYHFDQTVQNLANVLAKTIDVDKLLEVSQTTALPYENVHHLDCHGARVAISKDVAFSFLYGDNVDYLRRSNCEIVYFSPLEDSKLPENVQGLVLCGGYPELHAERLSQNATMRESIRQAIGNGMPYVAECGGYMYLHEGITYDGKSYPMVGVVKGECYQTDRLTRFGYAKLTSNREGLMFDDLKVHEFHYSDSTNLGTDYTSTKVSNGKSWQCGFGGDNYYSGYPHIYYYGNTTQVNRFLNLINNY